METASQTVCGSKTAGTGNSSSVLQSQVWGWQLLLQTLIIYFNFWQTVRLNFTLFFIKQFKKIYSVDPKLVFKTKLSPYFQSFVYCTRLKHNRRYSIQIFFAEPCGLCFFFMKLFALSFQTRLQCELVTPLMCLARTQNNNTMSHAALCVQK